MSLCLLNSWQIIDITIVDSHAGSIFALYDTGEVIDVERDNILLQRKSLEVVEYIPKHILNDMKLYENKPKSKNLSILKIEVVDDDDGAWEAMY